MGNVLFLFVFFVFLSLPTHRVRDYYFVCAIGGQQDGHLPFWLPGFVKFITFKLYVFVCIAEINILLLLELSSLQRAELSFHHFI